MTEAKALEGAARGQTEAIRALQDARALVEKGWTQHVFARDAAGGSVFEQDPRAVCWCASGALWVVGVNMFTDARRVFMRANGITETVGIPEWNDAPERTQADVLAAFDRAIELASAASARNAPPDMPLAGSTEGKEKP